MRRAAALGLAATTEVDVPLLGAVSRTEADIRTAIGRLQNPVQRLSDRLFWFHLPPDSREATNKARREELILGRREIASKHDDALRGLFAALEAGVDEAGLSQWARALQIWHEVLSMDEYWSLVLDLEDRGGFEPAALVSEIDALRADAVGLAAEGLVAEGRAALARNDVPMVRRILETVKELSDTGSWAAIAQEDIPAPAVEGLRGLCDAIVEDFSSNIVREQNAAERNRSTCDAALDRFREKVEPALQRVIQVLPHGHEAAQWSRERGALCLSGIANDYTWADDFVTCEQLYEEALSLAPRNTPGAIRIEDGLTQIRDAARKQRLFGALKPLSSAPPLRTINGFGFTLYGNSDYDPDTGSHVATYYFVALFIPIIPLTRYRVIQTGNSYRFLGKMPLRRADRWHLGIALTVVAAIILAGVITSSQNSDTSYVPPAASSSGSSSPDSGNTELLALKARIEAGRSHMAVLEKQLHPVIEQLTKLDARMKTLESELKSLDERREAGIEIDTDNYNATVRSYNALVRKRRALISANKADLQTYVDLSKQDSILVDQYNALLK